MAPTFRADDEALLARLEDAMVMEAIWRRQAGPSAPPLPARASGMIALVRQRPGGAAAVARALEGDLGPILALLVPNRTADEPPALLHHEAVHFGRVADILHASDPDASDEARLRSIAAWLALGEERRYLEDLARRAAGNALSAADAEAAGRSAALRVLDDLGQKAREGARERTPEAGRALATLARVQRAAQAAGLVGHAATSIGRRADTMRAGAIAVALAPILDALADAAARDASLAEAPAILARVHATWLWSEKDEQVERFAVDEATTIGWAAYRATGWEPLRALVAPMGPLVDRMADRCEADPRRHLAYAAKCAQFLVFRGECETVDARKWELIERALRVCPTHRNARLIACNLLCERAEVLLGAGALFQASAVVAAEQAITRAAELHPQGRKLEAARRRLVEVRTMRGELRP